MALLECSKTGDRSGAAWQKVLAPFVNVAFVISDAAQGITAGVQAVVSAWAELPGRTSAQPLHGLDVFHTNQAARGALAGPWRRAEAAWDDAAAADQRLAAIKRQGRSAAGVSTHARRCWDKAERLLAAVDRQETAWQRARAALAVFRPDGELNDRSWAEAEIQAALPRLRGKRWKKVHKFLTDGRSLNFLDYLHERLATAEPDAALRQMCIRRWWLRHQAPRPTPWAPPPQTPQARLRMLLDAKIRDGQLTAIEQAAYSRVAKVLRTTVRASSAVEGMNSVLRMQQGRHRKMTQGMLDLKRLYWNCRRFQTGQRRGQCPYEILGAPLPSTDFWTLLRTTGKPPGENSPGQPSNNRDAA